MAIVVLPGIFQSLLGLSTLYVLYYIYWQLTTGASRRRMIKEHGCKPVNRLPCVDKIFGLDTFFDSRKALKERRMLERSETRFRTMGTNTFEINMLGQCFTMTIEPDNLKAVQATQFDQFGLGSRRKLVFGELFGEGIFTTDGSKWQHSREMLRPNFARRQVADLETFEVHVDHLIQAIPRDGSTVNLQDLFFRLTIDSATEFLFGESTNCLAPGTSTVSSQNFADAFTRAQHSISNRGRFGILGFLFRGSTLKSDTKICHEFIDLFVEKGLAYAQTNDIEKGTGRYVFLHELVKQTKDKIKIRSELLNILLAGRDTTASLLSDVWFELAKRPDIRAKLRAEVDQLNGEKPTLAQIKDMKYLEHVLKESLRLHPVVPANSREANVDTVLPLGGGPEGKSPMFVPKGGIVAWHVYTMHRRKDIYGPDADEFKPERWESKDLRPHWGYLPFNGGPRVCLGQQYALTEASYTTIRLMQEFKDVESRDPLPWIEALTLTATGYNGAKVGLTPA